MIKTCTVCLREVETNARNFKYCDNCRAGSYRTLQYKWKQAHPNYMRDYRRKKRATKAVCDKTVGKQQERLRLERQLIIAKLFERRKHVK